MCQTSPACGVSVCHLLKDVIQSPNLTFASNCSQSA